MRSRARPPVPADIHERPTIPCPSEPISTEPSAALEEDAALVLDPAEKPAARPGSRRARKSRTVTQPIDGKVPAERRG
jgi:hypothetical protein